MAMQEQRRRILYVLLALLLIARFVVVEWAGLLRNTNSNKGDQTANLLIGLDIREGRALTDGNRQPLFPLLIAPFAQRGWSYYTASKLVGLAAGSATLLAILLLSRRRWGWGPALLAMGLMSVNGRFVDHTPRVLCEALLTGLSFASWVTSLRALERPKSWKCGLWAGTWVGLVYLTKGSGMLLVMAFMSTAWLLYRSRILRLPLVWVYLVGFLLISSPLFIYNIGHYGQPLYNYNSTNAFWFDSWGDSYLSKQALPTMQSYFAAHSAADILQREANGLLAVLPSLAESFDLTGFDGVSGWPFLALAVWATVNGLRTTIERKTDAMQQFSDKALAGVLLVIFYVFFAWYAPVSRAPRFFLPIVPMIYILSGRFVIAGAPRLWKWLGSHTRSFALMRPMVIVTATGLALWPLGTGLRAWEGLPLRSDPFARDAYANRDTASIVNWLNCYARDSTDEESLGVLWGPSHTILPRWQLLPQIATKPIPGDIVDWAELEEYIQQENLDIVLLDEEMYGERRDLLKPYLDKNGHQLLLRALPAGWTFAYVQRSEDTNWYILSLGDEGATPVTPLDGVRFGTSIALTGWAAQPATIAPGEPLEVTLVWQASEPIAEDWTVFVHLLDPSGNRVAQSDSYPLGGMYPTSHWRAGEAVRDRYTLVPGGELPSGEYQLAIGFYNLKDKARLPVSGGATTSNGEALLLPAGAKP